MHLVRVLRRLGAVVSNDHGAEDARTTLWLGATLVLRRAVNVDAVVANDHGAEDAPTTLWLCATGAL